MVVRCPESFGRWDEDPMVSGAICPFSIKTCIRVPGTRTQGELEAIVDTRCLISPQTVQKLARKTTPLNHPIHFEQVDSSLIGVETTTSQMAFRTQGQQPKGESGFHERDTPRLPTHTQRVSGFGRGVHQARSRGEPTTDPISPELKAATHADQWLKDNPNLLMMRDGLAWKCPKLYVPVSLRLKVLRCRHNSRLAGHFGFLKTLCGTPGHHNPPLDMASILVAKDESQCGRLCQKLLHLCGDENSTWKTARSSPTSMDFIVEFSESGGNTVIWTVVDLFSKQAHFTACSGLPSAKKLVKMLLSRFTDYMECRILAGIPMIHGVLTRVEFGFSSMNGAAEWTNAMVEQYPRCYVDHQQDNWTELLLFVEVASNNAVHSSTGLTLFQITSRMDFVLMPELPREPPTSMSLAEWMDSLRKAEKYKCQADKHRSPQAPFKVGDRVYLFGAATRDGYHGNESKVRREDRHNNILSPELKEKSLEFGEEWSGECDLRIIKKEGWVPILAMSGSTYHQVAFDP
ncbi:Tf2-1, partial [Ophiophagus hannah]